TQSVAGLKLGSLKVLTEKTVSANHDVSTVNRVHQQRTVLTVLAVRLGKEPNNRTFKSKVEIVPQNFSLNTRGLAVATVARVDRFPRHYVFSFLLRLIDENGLALVRVGIRNHRAFPHVLQLVVFLRQPALVLSGLSVVTNRCLSCPFRGFKALRGLARLTLAYAFPAYSS